MLQTVYLWMLESTVLKKIKINVAGTVCTVINIIFYIAGICK